jgi:hypothetical protein
MKSGSDMAALTDKQKFRAVIEEQRSNRLLTSRAPNPRRITSALDLQMLYGPEVDRSLGGEEPMVDEWESGKRIPTPEQIEALADLTGFTPAFFYQDDPPDLGPMILCGTGGCELIMPEPHPSDPTAEVIPLFGQGRLI